MLSRLKSKKDTTRRPFDDIGNIEHDGAEEDEDMVRWNRRKNKSKSKVNTDGDAKIQDKENAPPSQPSNKVDQFTDKKSRVLVAETKTTDAESKSMSCSPDKSISSPMPQVPPVNTTNTSSDQAKADFMTFEGLLQSGRCRLTPIKSSEKSQRSSPASCDFLSPSSIPRNDSVITTSDSSTLSNEQKFGTPPSVLTSKASTQRHSHSDHSRTVQPVSQDKSIQDNKKEDTPPSPTDIARIMEAERLFSKVRHNRMEIVERALKEGCDPHMTDQNGNTLMHICAQNNLAKMANLCLHYGCDINAFNKKGRTPLDYCDTYSFTAMGDWLVTMGAENGEYYIADHK